MVPVRLKAAGPPRPKKSKSASAKPRRSLAPRGRVRGRGFAVLRGLGFRVDWFRGLEFRVDGLRVQGLGV